MKSKYLKIIILFFALLLPVCIFLFLRIFGSNEFNIPIYYQTQTELDSIGCEGLKAPYQLLEVIFDGIEGNKNVKLNGITTVIFMASDSVIDKELKRQLNRVQDRLPEQMVNLQLVGWSNVEDVKGWNTDQIEKLSFQTIKRCVLLSSRDNQFVLIDSGGNIRGYYGSREVEEVDRLIVEVKILNSKIK